MKNRPQKLLINGPIFFSILPTGNWTLYILSLHFSDQGNKIGAESKVSAIGKRTGTYRSWEPIFIGTHSDPLYDERLSWEGRSDKMTHVSD